jgi:glycosyltransferase involved in cell wall biosynthesis
MKKLISIVTPCYNEVDNVSELSIVVRKIMEALPNYDYEHIFIDNNSTDGTQDCLRVLAKNDSRVKIIFNAKNFGHIRSPFYGMLQAKGDAIILLVADFQDPPELIPKLLARWEFGKKVVVCVKQSSKENAIMFALRTLYYRLIAATSEVEHISHFTGFGLYDRKFIDILQEIDDPYPYFRGIVAEYAFEKDIINYVQPERKKGKTKNNFFTLFDMALLGMVNHTKVPLRLMTITGFLLSLISFGFGIYYLVYKLINWSSVSLGIAPTLIGLFFLGSVQMLFMGLIGEYVGAIYTQTKKRPRVVEKERINF